MESIRGASSPAVDELARGVAELGRNLIPADGETGAEPVAVIRESLWRRRYSRDSGMIGRQITIGGQPRTVVGIMPDTFEFPKPGELWMPLEELTLGSASAIETAVRVFGVLLRPARRSKRRRRRSTLLSARFPSASLRVDEMRIVHGRSPRTDQADFAASRSWSCW